MPKRKRKSTKYSRKRGGRAKKSARYSGKGSYASSKKSKWRPSSVVIRQPSGVPDRIYVRLVYTELLQWTQTLGALADNVYRASSCFDPNLTGTGGQPYFFDQWAAMYNAYRVYGATIDVEWTANGGGAQNNLSTGITWSSSSTAFSTTSQDLVADQPYTKYKAMRMGATGVGQVRYKSFMSAQKIHGLTSKEFADDDYSGAVTGNPLSNFYAHVWCYTPDGNTVSSACRVKLTQYVCFLDRTRPAVS